MTLVHEYYREATRTTRVRSIPARATRWFLFTGPGVALDLAGAGGIGTATGVAVSLIDAFIFDRVTSGWRPSQFVRDLSSTVLGSKGSL